MNAVPGGNGNGNGNGGGLWRTVTIALLTFTLGILISGGGYVLRAPTRGEVDRISERQQIVLQRLAGIDERLRLQTMRQVELQRQQSEIERIVRDHVISDLPNRK